VRLPQLLGPVTAGDWHGADRRAGPGRPHQHFQFESVTFRPGLDPPRQVDRVTTKTALGVGQAHPGLHPKPEGGNRVGASATGRSARADEVTHAHGQRFRLIPGCRKKFRHVISVVLAIGI